MSQDADEMDALLARAGRALRDEVDGTSDQAARTRARIVASHRASAQRTAWAMAAAAVLAIGLGVPTVWAWSTGRLAEWLGGGEEAQGDAAIGAVDGAAGTEAEFELAAVTEAESEAEPESETEFESETEAENQIVAEGASAAEVARERPVSEERDRRMVGVDPAERRAYREAHALHFEARDPAGALGAWERYLAAHPSGRFAPEARYNRALCLVRLGRDEEARAALAPFAAGAPGSYRQREAAELVEALGE